MSLTLTLHRLVFPVLSWLLMQLLNVALGWMWAEAVAGNALTSTGHVIDANPSHPAVCASSFLPDQHIFGRTFDLSIGCTHFILICLTHRGVGVPLEKSH